MRARMNHVRLAVRSAFIVSLTWAMVATAAFAQSPPGQRQTGFQMIDDYVLEVNGTISNGATLYSSSASNAILVVSQDLPAPILLWPRSRAVESLQMLKVLRQAGGTAEIAPDPVIKVNAPFVIQSPKVAFLVDGVAAALAPKPPLLGMQDTSGMVTYSSVYKQRADAYTPRDELIEKLKAQGRDVQVRAFFGTWCPACSQMVPRLMSVAEGVGPDSAIRFEYYGLPKGAGFAADPQVEKFGITQVPTGVVLLDGKEVGRIMGDQWRSPERRIGDLLGVS